MNFAGRFYYVISLHDNKTSGIYTRTKKFSLRANANGALKENVQTLMKIFIVCNKRCICRLCGNSELSLYSFFLSLCEFSSQRLCKLYKLNIKVIKISVYKDNNFSADFQRDIIRYKFRYLN